MNLYKVKLDSNVEMFVVEKTMADALIKAQTSFKNVVIGVWWIQNNV